MDCVEFILSPEKRSKDIRKYIKPLRLQGNGKGCRHRRNDCIPQSVARVSDQTSFKNRSNISISCTKGFSVATRLRFRRPSAAFGMHAVAASASFSKGALLSQIVAEECASGPSFSTADFIILFSAIQAAVKQIAASVARAGIDDLFGLDVRPGNKSDDRDEPKKLDVVANDLMKAALKDCRRVAAIASEEDDYVVSFPDSSNLPFVAVFDPLDGSRNIDASIPTGTIFGIYQQEPGADAADAVLQQGSEQIAAGYALYSSATMLVVTLGKGTHGFTLDPSTGEFVLTHPDITIPKRGQIYSVNDARYFDWPEGLRRYIDTIRQGKGQNPKQYSARYICSLVADFHRTLLYGGVAMNPRSHLRLLYEANPLSFIAEQAGGMGSDGKRRILDIQPEKLHQRLPLFLGSPEDILELESYGDVQQLVNPGYTV